MHTAIHNQHNNITHNTHTSTDALARTRTCTNSHIANHEPSHWNRLDCNAGHYNLNIQCDRALFGWVDHHAHVTCVTVTANRVLRIIFRNLARTPTNQTNVQR